MWELDIIICLTKVWSPTHAKYSFKESEFYNFIIYCNILRMAMFLLNIQLHIRRIHLGKGRTLATQLLPPMQMELLHLWPTSSCRGCILFSMLCQIQMHHAAVACILAIIKSWALSSWHEHLFGPYHSLSKTCIWSIVISTLPAYSGFAFCDMS